MTSSSIRKPTKVRKTFRRRTGGAGLMRLTNLFTQRAAQFTEREVRAVTATLADPKLKSSQIAQAVSTAERLDVTSAVEFVGGGVGEVLSASAARTALDVITVDEDATDWAYSELLGAGEVAEKLEVSRSTLDNWRRAGKALAFPKGVRNYIFPITQFEGARPIPGLDGVRKHFASDEDAWEWLVTPNRMTKNAMPLDWLREGHRGEVTKAAEGALDYA